MDESKIRRQVYELTELDVQRFPVWEFALDEEGEENQDEATVRPHRYDGKLDSSDGMFIVRAKFTLADGTEFRGYLTPEVQGQTDLGTLQPIIITPHGQVIFWCGIISPKPEEISTKYEWLGKTSPSQVFPIRFESDVPLLRGPVTGEMSGFMVLENWETKSVRLVK